MKFIYFGLDKKSVFKYFGLLMAVQGHKLTNMHYLIYFTILTPFSKEKNQINSQILENTQVRYILQKYTFGKYTFAKYTFRKYTFRKYTFPL